MSTAPRHALPRAVVVGAALAVLVAVLLFANVLPLGIPGEWEWPYWPSDAGPSLTRLALLPPVLLGPLLLAALRTGARRALRRWETGLVLAGVAVLHALLLVVGIPAVTPPGWPQVPAAVRVGQLVASDGAFAYYGAALKAGDAGTLLATHEQMMADPATPDRIRTHPPGPPLVYLAILRAFDSLPYSTTRTLERTLGLAAFQGETLRAAVRGPLPLHLSPHEALGAVVCGYATALLGALAIIPVFLLGNEIGGQRVGLAAACVYAVTPSALVFVPAIDPWVTALAATCLWLTLAAARRGSLWLAAAAGTALWAALQVSFGAIALVPIGGLVLLLLRGRQIRRCALLVGPFVAVPVVLSLLVWGVTSYNTFHAFTLSQAAHGGVTARRTYLPWVAMDPLDFIFGFGVCASVCAMVATRSCIAVWRGWMRQALPSHPGHAVDSDAAPAEGTSRPAPLPSGEGSDLGPTPPFWPRPDAALLVAALATLLLLDLSGTVRGEVARIWQFLMPLLLVPAAAWLARVSPRFAPTVLVLLACQLLQALAMQANVAFMVPW